MWIHCSKVWTATLKLKVLYSISGHRRTSCSVLKIFIALIVFGRSHLTGGGEGGEEKVEAMEEGRWRIWRREGGGGYGGGEGGG